MADVVTAIYASATFLYNLYRKGKEWYDKLNSLINVVADFIHWDLIRKIHRLAYLTNSDYRELWRGILDSVRRASVSIGRDADFLVQLMYTSRAVIMATTALGGYSADIGENRYFYFMSRWLQQVNSNASWYSAHPSALFTDFESMVIDPNRERSTTYGQRILDKFAFIVDAARDTALDLAELHDRLVAFDVALEGKVRGWVGGMIDDAVDLLDFTDTAAFDNYVATTDKALAIIGTDLGANRTDLAWLIKKALYPGQFLSDLAHLDDLTRALEESRIADVASRTLHKGADEFTALAAPILMALEKLSDALKIELPPVEWAVPEVETPDIKPIGEILPVNTWFVGDF